MRLLVIVAGLCLACEELPPGTDVRDWTPVDAVVDGGSADAVGPDAPIDIDGAAPDAHPAELSDAELLDAELFDGASGVCAQDDDDGDGWGDHPVCPTPDCADDNRSRYPGAPEACNGLDDDCDGAVDEGLNRAACGIGECRREVPNCVDGRPNRCEPGAPEEERCNGLDDDCDGAVDEDAPTAACGQGACRRLAECLDGIEQPCTPGVGGEEQCNRVDDDCDGVVDEGHLAEALASQYTVLIQQHDGCDGALERIGPSCNAAMHRFCGGRGCAVTGYGPVESSGDTAWLTCTASATVRQVAFADLAAQHGPCDGQRQRIGPDCNAAIHRWCVAQGHVSGFGPVESGADAVTVSCVDAGAEVRGVAYATLAGQHWPCDGNRQRIGPDCNAAIHRWCRTQGFESGFGPVENSGGDAAVTCLRR